MQRVERRTTTLRRAGAPALELVEARPGAGAGGAPLLLLHGAFAGAWCWQERLLELLARQGRHVFALSLRGHGGSEGRRSLRLATIEDFLADLHAAIGAMPERPVLVGHSLGGYLAQLVLGSAPIRAVALMSSLPPDGLGLVGLRLAATDPAFWMQGVLGSTVRSRSAVELAALGVLFGEEIGPADRLRYARLMVPESPVALAEAHLPRWVLPAAAIGIPALVIQGERDRMICEVTASRTAFYHGAETARIRDGAHLLMLEPAADEAAGKLLDWLVRKRL